MEWVVSLLFFSLIGGALRLFSPVLVNAIIRNVSTGHSRAKLSHGVMATIWIAIALVAPGAVVVIFRAEIAPLFEDPRFLAWNAICWVVALIPAFRYITATRRADLVAAGYDYSKRGG